METMLEKDKVFSVMVTASSEEGCYHSGESMEYVLFLFGLTLGHGGTISKL